MRRWLTLCLALVLAWYLLPACGFAEDGRASTPLDGASEGQRENIELAAKALDGVIVKKGETFSFNEAVGPRSKENGYVSAVNGRGAKKLGGGVSQVAATLYLALKRLEGIQYLQKQTYGNQFAGGYVESGYDAVVTDYKKDIDFRFVNGYGDFAIRVRTTEKAIECELVAPEETSGPAQLGAAGTAQSDAPADGNAASDEQQANGTGQDDEHRGPVQGDEGGDPIESAAEDDPDVAGASRIKIDGPDAMLGNIQLASSGIYGVVVRRGGTFSFNALVGPNTEEAGYKIAPDGRGEAVVGGGVSVIASALWLAVRDMDDIEVIKKTTYGSSYSQSYVGDPDDAVRTDYLKGVDFRFRYKGHGSITIYAYSLEAELICEIRHNNG